MYTTFDSKFVLKTVTTEEKLLFLNTLLPGYLERMHSKESALVRVWGVFQVQCVGNCSANMILMDNASSSISLSRRKYDLKGSLYNRRSLAPFKVGKDCNFRDEVVSMRLLSSEADRLEGRLRNDSLMLASYNIMDYSVLITELQDDLPKNLRPDYIYRSSKGCYYSVAIIDFLQEFNFSKKMELFIKSKLRCVELSQLSTVEPKLYSSRFLHFMSESIR